MPPLATSAVRTQHAVPDHFPHHRDAYLLQIPRGGGSRSPSTWTRHRRFNPWMHVVRRKTCPDKGREGNGLFVSRRTEAPGHSTPARISTPQHAPWRPPLCMTCFDPLAIGWNRIHVSPGMGPAGDGLLGQQAKGRAGGRAGEPSRDSGPGPASRSPSAPRSAARGAAAESKGGSRESLENY